MESVLHQEVQRNDENNDVDYDMMSQKIYDATKSFYEYHSTLIKESHGIRHVQAVYEHAKKAIDCYNDDNTISLMISVQYRHKRTVMEILAAALLHDTDDKKYFPKNTNPDDPYPNARCILEQIPVPQESIRIILQMISYVSCSDNGNSVPEYVQENEAYHLLIPRWSDRLEAVGTIGVIRCYQYNQELGDPLSTNASPRPKTEEEVWLFATPGRFQLYQERGGVSTDMIAHYYDKLLHVARPPPSIVRNKYLEDMAKHSSQVLIEVCVRYGQTGIVDEKYIQDLIAAQ